MAKQRPAAIETLRGLLTTRPAETTTAAAGAIGLLLAQALDGGDDVTTGLVILLAVLPGIISYTYRLGHFGSTREIQSLNNELQDLTLQAVRRARLGDPRWKTDLHAVTKILAALPSQQPARTNDEGSSKKTPSDAERTPQADS